MVVVKFSSAIRAATDGQRKIEIEFSGTFDQLLKELANRFGEGFEKRIFEGEVPRPYINFYLNGEDIRYLDKFDTVIDPKDVVDLIPSVAGG